MTYTEFNRLVRKANLTLKAFAELLKMNPASLSNYAKKGEVPMHLAIIATLLSEMHEQGIDYSSILDRVEISTKKPRGSAKVGKFGGDKQIDLELGDD
ncbi:MULTISPECIES: hypothetical protein [unclassified Acinetobacter]|jgi:hypothetical protein|uniref:XRE family transcriptional regulator n=2 Tax=Moraxellaceae TaxID=468 RepID=A0ABY8S1W1_9GAMM|nr:MULTISPECIES: hypothetical protein [unclassified Acinetobacter]MDH0029927.1 XRE family transcriptional regulator [Acinetobacter sp. GD04021]MDH0885309.1 XRE family transcriptional regulator [Acinetobacter sp. GD03873]MDH1081426.1 XRE family transcriptional regulator [Acinetobacter sp. GD03983]MDH2188792.1 XRE family transcriptional regulator [Acinetobacter sp. GD03645]MDH2203515.1 XRE family transcriptional regulator [Acinetobacter sp. GD03647]